MSAPAMALRERWRPPHRAPLAQREDNVGGRRAGPRGVVYSLGPTGDLPGLGLRTGERVWREHVDFTKTGPAPGYGVPLQLLQYEEVLIARSGKKMVRLRPRFTD